MSGVTSGRDLRVGIMSFAHVHAATYARLLARWPGVEVRAADPGAASAPADEFRGPELAASLGVGYAESYEDLLAATGTNNGQIPVGERAWFTDPALSVGGALVDHIVHVADLIDTLTGLRPLTVRAATNRILHADKPQVRAETGGLVMVRYEGGFILTIDCSWSQPDSAPTWGGLTLHVVGSNGIAEIDPFAQHVGGFTELGPSGLHLSYAADTDELLLAAFLDGARRGHQPQPDGQVGIRTLAIVLAAQESARTGLVVDVV